MRSSKRTLAGLAAGALVAGLVPFAVVATATSANAANISGTVSPVRPGTVGSIPAAVLSFAKTQAQPSTVSLVTAPSATARVTFSPLSADDTALPTANDDSVVLGTADSSLAAGLFTATTGDDSVLGVSVNEAGSYTVRFGTGTDLITASFTTAGAPASIELTPASQTILTGGVATMAVTIKDSAGNTTQPAVVDTIALSDNTTDTIVATSTGTDALETLSWDNAPAISDGSATFYVNNANLSTDLTTVTATPQGTMGTLAAATATVAKSGTVNSIPATSITITSPTNALSSPANTTDTIIRTVEVPELTTSLTVQVDDSTGNAAGSTVRLKVYPSSGTVNGAAYTNLAPLYLDLTTNSSRVATTTLTLGGGAVINNSTVTIEQVGVTNLTLGSSSVVVTQKTPVVSATGVTTSPSDSVVAALGATIPVTVTVVDDSFGIPQANYAVSISRGATFAVGNVLSTATTNSSGVATVDVTSATGAVNGTVEAYSLQVAPPVGTTFNVQDVIQATYTTSGGATTLTVTPVGAGNAVSTTTPSPTGWLAPLVLTPDTAGAVNGDGGAATTQTFIVSTGVNTGDPTRSFANFTANTDPLTNVTFTVPTGVRVSSTAPVATTLYSGGAQSVTVASNANVFIWATQTGVHDITVTGGGLTVTAKLKAVNNAERAYNIALTPATTTATTGAFLDATLSVTDMFGNAVTTDDTYAVTGSTTGQVRLSTGATTADYTTGATGTRTVSLVAGGSAGTGILTATNTNTPAGSAWAADYSPPAGIAAPVTSATTTVTVTAAPVPVPTTITWGDVPTEVAAGSITTLVATVLDQNGDAIDNEDINVVVTGDGTIGTSGIKTATLTTNAAGQIAVGVVAQESGSFTVTATADTNTGATATTSSVTIDPRPVPAEITVLPAGGGVVPTEVEAGSVVPMVATVKDDDGNPEASEAVEVSITGDATFANGNKQYVANTGAAGTLAFTVIAGDSGSFTVTATVISTPSVTASAGPIAITPKPEEKTIFIIGGRGEGVDPVPAGETCRSIAQAGEELPNRCVAADGITSGFAAGSAMTPEFRFPGQTSYSAGNPVSTDAEGEFDWFRRTGKKIYVKFTSDGVESNRVIIAAR